MSPKSKIKYIGFGGPRGGGKAQPLNAKILTPTGWVRMGDVQVGDIISNPDGSTQKVIQIHPQGIKDIYKVTMDDDSCTEVCGEHLWKFTVTSKTIKRNGKNIADWFIGDTLEIKKHIEEGRRGWPSIPLAEPVRFYNRYTRPIDPYLLGCIIGDGCLVGNYNLIITTKDQFFIDKISGSGADITVTNKDNHQQIFIVGEYGRKVRGYLKGVGLLGKKSIDKFIPEAYLYAPVEDRISLIQGLMDTDGHVDSRGHMSFTTVSEQLAKDFQYLIRGIGGKATIWDKDASYTQDDGQRVLCSRCYTVQFNTNRNPELASLPRKKERTRWDYNGGVSELKRRIKSVEFSRRAEAKCITVDNPNSLYITDDFIVTHNSYGMRSWFVSACWGYPIEACIIRRHRVDLQKNHINAFKSEMKAYIDAGYIKYNERDNAAYFKNGSILYFDYCDKSEDLEKIQGQAYDLLGLEESTQFNEHQINVMISSCRGSNTSNNAQINFPNKILMTFNWGGMSHSYHRRLFWDLEFKKDEDRHDYEFIFAPFESNKILQSSTPDYQKQLRKLPEQLQQAWIDGDPDAFTGTMFSIVDDFHIVNQDKLLANHNGLIPQNWKLFGSLDAATGDFCSFGLYTKSPAGYIYKIFTYYIKNMSPQDHVEAICERIARCPYTEGRRPSYVLADRFAFAGNSRKEIMSHDITWADIFRERGIYLRKANDKRIQGCMALQYALDYKYDYKSKMLVRTPKLRFFSSNSYVSNRATIKELTALERDVNNTEDINQKAPDHAYDETRYAVMGALTPQELGMPEEEHDVDKMADYGSQRDTEELFNAFSGEKESWEKLY